jgi:hypothetical protein
MNNPDVVPQHVVQDMARQLQQHISTPSTFVQHTYAGHASVVNVLVQCVAFAFCKNPTQTQHSDMSAPLLPYIAPGVSDAGPRSDGSGRIPSAYCIHHGCIKAGAGPNFTADWPT